MILEAKSISFLRKVARQMNDLQLGFSGGKDSVVIIDLARRSGIDFNAIYSNTTIDPPGTMPFIRDNFSDVKILHPEKSFFTLVKMKGLPTRQTRFCCEILKERASIGKNNIVGVRAAESSNRIGRDYIQCDSRKEQKGAKHIYPIYDWHDEDVWEYIYKYNLPVAPCYKDGCTRLGCVGCPLATVPKRKFEFNLYPKFYLAMRRSIEIGMQNNPQWKITTATNGDAELAMQWWISKQSINQYFNTYDFEKTNIGWIKNEKPLTHI